MNQNIQDDFLKELNTFLDKFGKENKCNVSLRLPVYVTQLLEKLEVKNVEIIPQFTERMENNNESASFTDR